MDFIDRDDVKVSLLLRERERNKSDGDEPIWYFTLSSSQACVSHLYRLIGKKSLILDGSHLT